MTNISRYSSVGIGLETLFNRLDALQDSTAKNYPPYNIIVRSEGVHDLEIALAGWSRENIEVVTERNVLTVSARRSGTDEREYAHKGISCRSFSRNWQLSDDTVVNNVSYENGMLTVTLNRVVPEAQQRKVLEIN
ncbi:Hsp20 small heat shock protein [Synechococcus phage S-N03]|uniref:Hsp20 small heat shock protein n=1 Tax=Synechococcus phage S-N03 TaxID=2718943 RepID=A0A6G8R5T0_9CAUD|nr:Hsp20 heat shock protein [Synechococcus phage S-N03]QIN96750.1 Hsp20 small heat shock protein [Synechococcus phage S-N03]